MTVIWFWILWGVMFVGGEGWALANRTPGDTLSETVWYWVLGYRWAHPAKGNGRTLTALRISGNDIPVKPPIGTVDVGLPVERKSAWTWRTFAVGAFLLWLMLHLTFGWFAG